MSAKSPQNTADLKGEIDNLASVADRQIQAALAIIDAARVLCALERAPEHHDTHPSHDIKNAHYLVSMADNDYGVALEKACDDGH